MRIFGFSVERISTKSRICIALIAIISAAVMLRGLTLFQSQSNPMLRHPILDEAYYVAFGERVAAGFLSGEDGVYFMDPLYGYVVGLFFWLFGESTNALRIMQIGADAVSLVLVFLLGKKVAGEREGLAAAAIYAAYPVAYFYTLLILKTTVTTTVLLALVLLGLKVTEKDRGWFLLGVAVAISVWLRGNLLLLALFFPLVWWCVNRPTFGHFARRTIVFAVGLCATLFLGALRNYVVAGEWIMLSSQAGRTLYHSNHPDATSGRWTNPSFFRAGKQLGTLGAERIYHDEAVRRVGREMTSREVSAYWRNEAFTYMVANPVQTMVRFARKFYWNVGDCEIPNNFSYHTASRFSGVLRSPLPGFSLLFALGVPGLALAVRQNRRAWWLLAPVATSLVTILIFYASSRFRFPMTPILAIGAGVWLLAVGEWINARQRKGVVAVAISGLLFVVSETVPDSKDTDTEAYHLAKAFREDRDISNAYKIAYEAYQQFPNQARFPALLGALALPKHRYDEAIDWSEKAIRLDDRFADPFHNLGVAWLGKNDPAKAIRYLQEAKGRNSPPVTDLVLFHAYQAAGKPAEAQRALDDYNQRFSPGDPGRRSEPDFQ